MKNSIFITILMLFGTVSFAGNWVSLNSSEKAYDVQVLEVNDVRTVLNFTVNGYGLDSVLIDGKNYVTLEDVRKEGMIMEAGSPQLPLINRSIMIPDDGVMDYRIISAEYIEIRNIDIAPSKGALLRSFDPEKVPYEFSDVYQKDEFYPEKVVDLLEPHIVRDYRGVVVEVNAFRYNPVKRILRIYTDVQVEVEKTGSGGVNTIDRITAPHSIDPQFDKIYKRHFINLSGLDYPILLESGSMLIICYDDFMDLMTPFLEWKIQRGIPTNIVPVSEAGSTPFQIKEYIADVYHTSNLCYVLIVGDAAQVPTFSEQQDSDPVYSLLQGGDSYPEIFVGRFSAENAQQVLTQVNRTIDYEKFPDPNGEWYDKGLVIGSTSGPFWEHNGEYDFTHMTIIAYKLLDHTYTQVDSAYDPWCTMQNTVDIINDGRSLLFYAGHGGPEGWGTSGISTTEVFNLVNSDMLPHVNSVGCNTGQFVEYTCLGESWLRATDEVTGEPTGGIGFYGSVEGMTGPCPLDMQDECIDLLMADSMLTMGGMSFNGSMKMIDVYPGTGPWEFANLTIFGDPSVSLRGGVPFEPIITHNPEIPVGASSFELTIISQNGPVRGAMVCGMNEDVYATAVTNSSGQTMLEFDEPIANPGTLILTVSGGDMIPYIVELEIFDPSSAYVIYSDNLIQDDITGNNNGQLDISETIELGITISNLGISEAQNVWAVLQSENTNVTIESDSSFMGSIPAGVDVTVDRAFELTSGAGSNDGDPIVFLLTASDGIQSWESSFSLVYHSPKIEFSDILVDDNAGGNGDSLLAAGETADLIVTLRNVGSYTGENISARLTCGNPFITINSDSSVCGEIEVGRYGTAVFNVTADPQFSPPGTVVEFDVAITGNYGYADETDFIIPVGDIVASPTGPDEYGYSAYDSLDYPFYTQYDWMELVSDSGGVGIEIHFTELDEIIHLPLPFEFQYYGMIYDSISVTTKGHICMGITDELDYTSSPIPNPDGPPAMICPLWGDLDPAGATVGGRAGGVWYYYDESLHYVIIEYNYTPWYMFVNEQTATFQIILYDEEYYPTLTGDGRIKFQYKELQEWGPTGIENYAEDDGLSYRDGSIYPFNAAHLGDGTAITFSTAIDIPEVEIVITPVTTPVIIPAGGGSFDYDIEVTNTGIGSITFDTWIDVVLPNGSVYGPLLLRESLTLDESTSILRNMTQTVPGSAAAGEYTYSGHVGYYPDVVLNFSSFPFEKEAGDIAASEFTEWILNGWGEYDDLGVGEIPTKFALHHNYPNPFNPATTIEFDLPVSGKVSLVVFDIMGRVVSHLAEGYYQAGYYSVHLDARNLSSGVYFARLQAAGHADTKKLLLLK